MPEQELVLSLGSRNSWNRLLRHDQDMHWSRWFYILQSQRLLILIHDFRRHLARGNLFEKRFTHNRNPRPSSAGAAPGRAKKPATSRNLPPFPHAGKSEDTPRFARSAPGSAGSIFSPRQGALHSRAIHGTAVSQEISQVRSSLRPAAGKKTAARNLLRSGPRSPGDSK